MRAPSDPLQPLTGASPGGTPGPGPDLEAAVVDLRSVRTRGPGRQLVRLGAVSLAYGAAVLALVTVRRDVGELPVAWLLGGGLTWAAGFAAGAYLAMVPRAGAMLPRMALAGAAAAVLAPSFVLLGLLVHPSGPSSIASPTVWQGHGCLELGLACALVPIGLGLVLLRGAIPVGARGVAAALGAAGGSLGGLVLHLHCPITDALHQGVIHGGVVVVAALLAVALAPRALELR